MRSHAFLLLVAVVFSAFTFAWTPEDHEVFRVRDELNTLEGKDTSFYEFLGVPASASLDDINKQFRKRSRQLHPDKAIPGLLAKAEMPTAAEKKKGGVTVKKGPTSRERTAITKEANDRYAHLGVVTSILRGPARDRYDYFLRNGFPLWRGTGYYYQRFRPGLFTVLFGLFFMFGGVAHYGAMYLTWKRQKEHINRYVTHARKMAYGNEAGVPGIPGVDDVQAPTPPRPAIPVAEEEEQGMALNRRQKRMQEKDTKGKPSPKLATRAARLARIRGSGDDSPSASESEAPQTVQPVVSSGSQGSRKKVVSPNGKVLVVDADGNVFLEEKTVEGNVQEFLLDVSSIEIDNCEYADCDFTARGDPDAVFCTDSSRSSSRLGLQSYRRCRYRSIHRRSCGTGAFLGRGRCECSESDKQSERATERRHQCCHCAEREWRDEEEEGENGETVVIILHVKCGKHV